MLKFDDPLTAAHAEVLSATDILEDAKNHTLELRTSLALAEDTERTAHRNLSAALAKVQALEREPQHRADLERLVLEVQQRLAKSDPRSPTTARVRDALAELDRLPVSAADKVGYVKGLLHDLSNSYRLDRAVWDSRVPPLPGRGGRGG